MSLLLSLWVGAATAEVPLPSFRDEVARAHWAEINDILERSCQFERLAAVVVCRPGATERAIAAARAFERQVFPDAGIAYLAGLAHRYDGNDRAAVQALRRSVRLDPAYQAAWYDLGEVEVKAGRMDRAREAFTKVAELVTDGNKAWLGHWRLAEVAAHSHDAPSFERHIKRALELGFSFRQIAGLPNWQAFYRDPALKGTMERLLTVYADPETIGSLTDEAPER